jgi:hypothetical protein
VAFLSTIAVATLLLGTPASAQTRSARDTATAYGARLNAKGEPANLNANRINNRVNSRLETRLSLRIERYRPDSTNNPAAAFTVRPTDNARVGTETTLSPLSTSSPLSASQAYDASPQTPPVQTDDGTRSR